MLCWITGHTGSHSLFNLPSRALLLPCRGRVGGGAGARDRTPGLGAADALRCPQDPRPSCPSIHGCPLHAGAAAAQHPALLPLPGRGRALHGCPVSRARSGGRDHLLLGPPLAPHLSNCLQLPPGLPRAAGCSTSLSLRHTVSSC